MNALFEKILPRTLFAFILLLLLSCTTAIQPPTDNVMMGPPADTTVYAARLDSYVCPTRLGKLCEAYGLIRTRYIRHFSDDELTGMFVRGVTQKIRESNPSFVFNDKEIHKAKFTCSPNAQKICDAYDSVKDRYKKPVFDKHLIEMFINGVIDVINETDPYTRYASTVEKNVDYMQYPGIGIIATKENVFPSDLKIQVVKEYNPAWFARLKRGDRISRVNGISVSYMTKREANALIRGKVGTRVRLTVISGCEQKIRTVSLIRKDTRDVMSGEVKVLDGRYGYVRLAEFNIASALTIQLSIEQFEKEHGTMKGLVLDIRNDPGGAPIEANKLVSLFVKKGPIFFEQGQNGKLVAWDVIKGSKDILRGGPIVVLVNGDSASASEITAGAFQDLKRATIVGTETYGKGCMQTKYTFKDGSQFDLTRAHTITPKHKNIDKKITPDVVVAEGANESCTGDEQLATALRILREKGG
jgi:carboxyl-terminal processing protease